MHSLVFLVKWQHGHAPEQALGLDAGALQHRSFEDINGGVGGDIEISAADGDAVNPGILRKTVEELARLVEARWVWLINKERLATACEETPCAIKLQSEKGLGGI